jgi:hypothetical protein
MAERKTANLLSERHFWGALVIIVVWIATLFVGIFADADLEVTSGAESVTIPVVWGVAALAFVTTWVVAWASFRDRS